MTELSSLCAFEEKKMISGMIQTRGEVCCVYQKQD